MNAERVSLIPIEKDVVDRIEVGLPLGCDYCVLPERYAGATFYNGTGKNVCNFCLEHQEPSFLGGERLVQDLDLKEG